MTKQELNKKAEDIFKSYNKENVLYCIDDGNFWLKKDKITAELYSKKLNKELIEINKTVKETKPKRKKTQTKEDIKKEVLKEIETDLLDIVTENNK